MSDFGTTKSGKLVKILFALVIAIFIPLPVQAQEEASESVYLVIPQAGVSTAIVDIPLNDAGSWDMTNVEPNVGHLEGTAWINAPGNIALAGHFDLEDGTPGVFARLNQLKVGDWIVLILPTDLRRYYRVEALDIVATNDLTPIYPTVEDRLTLITCHTYDPENSTYIERFVVSAVRVQSYRNAPTLSVFQ